MSLGVYGDGGGLGRPLSSASNDWMIFLRMDRSLIDSKVRESGILKYKHPPKHFFFQLFRVDTDSLPILLATLLKRLATNLCIHFWSFKDCSLLLFGDSDFYHRGFFKHNLCHMNHVEAQEVKLSRGLSFIPSVQLIYIYIHTHKHTHTYM